MPTFLTIPRTGSMWRANALRNAGVSLPVPGHSIAPEAEILGYKGPFYVFCRHPLAWWKSVWGYCMLRKWKYEPRFPIHCQNPDFEIFILKVLTICPGWFSMWVRAYEYNTTMFPMEQMKIVIPQILSNHGISYNLEAFLNTPITNQSLYKVSLPKRIENRLLEAENYVMEKYYAST